eukprot:m.888884 g.888884  ORF g.888884 m.888884 type:complete len:348 (+) comp23640_c0_seq6:889-1932(+)
MLFPAFVIEIHVFLTCTSLSFRGPLFSIFSDERMRFTCGRAGQMYGTCCTEMDVWESNKMATAVTPHTCTCDGQTRCTGIQCGDDASGNRENGVCDKDGSDFNPFRLGDKSFFGPGANFSVDSSQSFTVVTQWVTSDKTDAGDLTEIRRHYVQNGKTIPTRPVSVGGQTYDSVTDDFTRAQKTLFNDTNGYAKRGGMKRMGDVLDRGVVLVMSLWADYAVHMLWLDSDYPTDQPTSKPGVARGTCATTSGVPSDLINNSPDSQVVYSNIRWGPIGSTTPPGPNPPAPPGPNPPPPFPPNPPPPPGPNPPPPPSGCPGGNLAACIALCPSNPPDAYKACVADCVKRCD